MSGGWEPISTAPHDGTAIYVAHFADDGATLEGGVVTWDVDCWMAVDSALVIPDPDGWRPLGGAR